MGVPASRLLVTFSGRCASDDGDGTGIGAFDQRLQGWFISPDDIQICKRQDSSEWLLGKGAYGKVRTIALFLLEAPQAEASANNPVPQACLCKWCC